MKLKLAIGAGPHTDALLSGKLSVPGIELDFTPVVPIIAAFRRMVRGLEFDVCEMAPTSYLIARSMGLPIVALPIFLARGFHHDALVCNRGSDIHQPKQLEGKRVGIRAYTVTTGMWFRGILKDDYGVDLSKITWVVDDEEAVRDLKLPSNVVHAPDNRSLRSLMSEGELDAAFNGPAGIGREGPPDKNWNSTGDGNKGGSYRPLFPDAPEREVDWYNRTGICPLHGVVVIKQELLTSAPNVARSLYRAFRDSKLEMTKALASRRGDPSFMPGLQRLSALTGGDPLPYGIPDNLRSIKALLRYAADEKLIPQHLSLSDFFIDTATM